MRNPFGRESARPGEPRSRRGARGRGSAPITSTPNNERAASFHGRKRRRGLATLGVSLGLLAGACTFDPDDRCGPHQVIFGDNDVCVCEEGAAPTATGCVPCGEHEVPGSTGCVCETGYARSSGSTCEAVPTALGAACSETEPCEDATFDHCQLGASHTGYCTSAGCASSSECVGGYACDTKSQPSFCKRPPTGLGKSCAAASDCADGEATFCDTFMTHVCLVEGCSLESDDCFEGWVCTDLSQFGVPKPLCLAAGAP